VFFLPIFCVASYAIPKLSQGSLGEPDEAFYFMPAALDLEPILRLFNFSSTTPALYVHSGLERFYIGEKYFYPKNELS
jgi:hypothetical protein